jgi:hypothetical protein
MNDIEYSSFCNTFFTAKYDGLTVDCYSAHETPNNSGRGYAPPYITVNWSLWPKGHDCDQPDRLTLAETVTTYGRTPDQFRADVEAAIRRVARLALASEYPTPADVEADYAAA